MAVPRGAFTTGGAQVTAPGGAFAYAAGASYPQYYAGTFFIDTGYDDPVLWTSGVDAAEIYGARVYGTAGAMSSSPAAGTLMAEWRLTATPMWAAKLYVTPHSIEPTQRRVHIQVDAYLVTPYTSAATHWYRLNNVNWSLYRL